MHFLYSECIFWRFVSQSAKTTISFPEQTLSFSASTSQNSAASAARAETLSDALGTRLRKPQNFSFLLPSAVVDTVTVLINVIPFIFFEADVRSFEIRITAWRERNQNRWHSFLRFSADCSIGCTVGQKNPTWYQSEGETHGEQKLKNRCIDSNYACLGFWGTYWKTEYDYVP